MAGSSDKRSLCLFEQTMMMMMADDHNDYYYYYYDHITIITIMDK